jgi:hypothetical protein
VKETLDAMAGVWALGSGLGRAVFFLAKPVRRVEAMTRQRQVRVILDTAAAIVRYYPGPKVVHHEIRRFVHGAEFRNVLDKGLDALRAYHACKWLSDDRGNGARTPQDAAWAENDWAPRVLAAGWRFWALVLPEKVPGQMSMRRKMAFYEERGVTVETFATPEDGLAWLEQRKAPLP